MRNIPIVEDCSNRAGERGAALIMALMVALVLVFLGMGLLLQTSLGLQAAGTDRWVTKALYAADAGAMMQIEMIQLGVIGTPGTFVLEDDSTLPGLLKGEFSVSITDFCESQPATPVIQRTIGGLAGITRAAVEADVSSFPFMEETFVPVTLCY